MGATKFEAPSSVPERVAFPISEFCHRNGISRVAYHRLRSEGRGPVEMRLGLNLIRVTREAELAWQLRMQEPNADFEQRATARAVKAGDAAVKSSKHISKARRGRRRPPPPSGTGVRDE